ncbi:hypothetical protein F5Y00DRAFT_261779 [Daldinia vernicosa]|uniref:uncharacterized protein n=1 Tax=Daldinia vernicosa TaxID=114800 RepID=UPI00200859EA|nr:uncharacterized protein F5Y00DRAFT_261779 [Daldinia vernicosa]KAI0849310.1 hypothetical protein F5Y00DRAFT_261779 [Daldinia vernicosa]
MRQCWHLVNFDKWTTVLPRGAKTCQFITSLDGAEVLGSLAVPDLNGALSPESELARSREHNLASRLVTLPQEIFDDIVAELPDAEYVLSLALTCSYLWRVLLPNVKGAIIAIEAPWAGDRLIFVGDYARGFPPNCKDYENGNMPEREMDPGDGVDAEMVNENPLYFGINRCILPRWPSLEVVMKDQAWDCPDIQLLLRLVTMLRSHPGSKRPGVLRNLTKQQYVLDSKLAESKYPYSLVEAIVVRTQWTESAADGLDDWVGDRFDIRSIEHVPEGWTDVSDEAIDLIGNAAIRSLRILDLEDWELTSYQVELTSYQAEHSRAWIK